MQQLCQKQWLFFFISQVSLSFIFFLSYDTANSGYLQTPALYNHHEQQSLCIACLLCLACRVLKHLPLLLFFFSSQITVILISSITLAAVSPSCNYPAQTHGSLVIGFYSAIVILLFTLALIILSTCLSSRQFRDCLHQSEEKAFSTCSSHMIVISSLIGCIFMYANLQQKKRHP